MGQMDYKLELLLRERADASNEALPIDGSAQPENMLVDHQPDAQPHTVNVLLHYKGSLDDLASIEELGFKKSSHIGDIAAGSVSLDDLRRIEASPHVISIEHSRPLKYELDVSAVEAKVTSLQRELKDKSIPCSGKGVIIGVIDSGFEFTHPCFLDANGNTRIIAFWDQNKDASQLPPSPHPLSSLLRPEGFTFGVEYLRERIDVAVKSADAHAIVPHWPSSSHGTHVAGIAAGKDLATPAGQYIGMAPESELIFVALKSDGQFADSKFAIDALRYMVEKAKAEPVFKPLVINLSQGDNFGPHDGTSLLEQAIDNLFAQPGIAVVNSAGNAAEDRAHARGQVSQDGETAVAFEIAKQHNNKVDKKDDTFDIWYSGADRFDVALRTPDGSRTVAVPPESDVTLELPNGNRAQIQSSIDAPENHDNRIVIVLQHGSRDELEHSTPNNLWEIILIGRSAVDGRFDIWIDDDDSLYDIFPTFVEPAKGGNITTPGTSSQIITVGAFITKLRENQPMDHLGTIWPQSSIGPTRKGGLKPDISAPGSLIWSSGLVKKKGDGLYIDMEGTSMAAPHVAGVIALLFEVDPTLTQKRIKDILQASASEDEYTSTIPNTTWGYGKLNAQGAYEALTKSMLSPKQ